MRRNSYHVNSIVHQTLNLPTRAPVMVLPGAILFPHSLMPLYIFEPRYREMLAWALEHDRMFCIALLKPGVSEAATDDDFHHTAGLGLVRACVGRDDGTSHLVLQGMVRVRFTGFLQEQPFRVAALEELRGEGGSALDDMEHLSALVLDLCAQYRTRGVQVPESLDAQLAQVQEPEILCDIVAHTFLRDPFLRQRLLEELQVAQRLRNLISYLAAEIG